jgi:hypothetical protein
MAKSCEHLEGLTAADFAGFENAVSGSVRHVTIFRHDLSVTKTEKQK